MITTKGLDEWYRTVNSIYINTNFYRTPESVFCHLVEVFGGLSLVASHKTKPGIVPKKFLAKAIGWWMALCGKVGVQSLERMVWAKFPYVCTYCHEGEHQRTKCTKMRELNRSPDWDKLRELGKSNHGRIPQTLSGWQKMFHSIYPRSEETTHERNFSRLAEELGELGEAVRALPFTRAYFLSEAADVFAWLMGEANQLEFEDFGESMPCESAERELYEEYPDKCRHCGSEVCRCTAILESTLGRIAKEIPESAFPEEGGLLFTAEKAQAYFRLVNSKIVIAGEQMVVTLEMVEELKKVSSALMKSLGSLRESQGHVDARLSAAFEELQKLASLQQFTQQSLDTVVMAIKELPSESRSLVLGFLNHIAAGAWLQVLLQALRG